MIQYTVTIDNAKLEAAIARKVTLAQGDDLSKVLHEQEMKRLEEMSTEGFDLLAKDQIEVQVRQQSEQDKAEAKVYFESAVEATKPK